MVEKGYKKISYVVPIPRRQRYGMMRLNELNWISSPQPDKEPFDSMVVPMELPHRLISKDTQKNHVIQQNQSPLSSTIGSPSTTTATCISDSTTTVILPSSNTTHIDCPIPRKRMTNRLDLITHIREFPPDRMESLFPEDRPYPNTQACFPFTVMEDSTGSSEWGPNSL